MLRAHVPPRPLRSLVPDERVDPKARFLGGGFENPLGAAAAEDVGMAIKGDDPR